MDNEYQDKYAEVYYNWRKQQYKEHPLRTLFFEMTLRCNARCEHCGSNCGDTIPKDEITKEEICKVLEDVVSAGLYAPKDIMLAITGGEPLMRKDLFEILAYANSLGFPWGMTTNGMLIDEEVVKKMVETNMYSVSVSIDGLKETHEKFRRVPNCYEKILHGIELMQKEPSIKIVQVTTCVNKRNIDELEDLYKLLLDHGVKYWRVVEVDPIGRARNNDEILLDGEGFRRMFRFIKEKQIENKMEVTYGCGHYLGPDKDMLIRENPFLCFTGLYVGSVLSNGDIFVCPDVKRRPELIQGNIRKDNFMDVWENKFQVYRNINRTCNPTCKKCKEWKMCGGDAFHTWDFDENRPLICSRELFKEDYELRERLQKKKAQVKKKLEKEANKKSSKKKS